MSGHKALNTRKKTGLNLDSGAKQPLQAELLYFNSCKHKKQEVHSACPDLSVSFIKLLRNPLLRV